MSLSGALAGAVGADDADAIAGVYGERPCAAAEQIWGGLRLREAVKRSWKGDGAPPF